MAKGIQDLGIGLGYLYKTKPDGVTIVAVEKNTADGVRSMKTQGTTNGPVIADRPAVGTITVNSVASVGAITAITIGGVNQIGANINVVSSTASVVAAQIADAINRYSPVGTDDFTAQVVGDIVYVFSPSNTGSTSNGLTITVTATDPSINTSTTPLNNGSSQNAVYDTIFGYRFFIDADYGSAGTPGGGTATPSSLTYAAEITQYITLRGLQSGIFTTTATIASDSITSLTRCSAITQVLVSNQGGAATDVLAFVQTEGFAVGDEIQLSSAAPGTQVPTLEDANVTTSTVGTPNLYLTDETSFVMDSYTSITLQLRNIPSVGLAWVETGRSIADGVIATTVSGIVTLASGGTLRPKGLYHITDLGDSGTYVTAISSTKIAGEGVLVRNVPYNYNGCWRSTMAAPAVGQRFRYRQVVYQSVTGAVGTAPDTDTTNWLAIAKTNATYYQPQAHQVGLSDVSQLGTQPIIWERDTFDNFIAQSAKHRADTSKNAYELFSWRVLGSTTCYGNTVNDGIFDCSQSDGSVYNNTVYAYGVYETNSMASGTIVSSNQIYNSGSVTANFITNFVGNKVYGNSASITAIGTSGANFYQIAHNEVQGIMSSLTSASGGNKSVEYTTIKVGAEITASSFAGAAMIRYTQVFTGSSIENCVFGAPATTSNIEACILKGSTILTSTDAGGRIVNCEFLDTVANFTLAGNVVSGVTFNATSITMTANDVSNRSTVTNCLLSFTGSIQGAQLTGLSSSGTPTVAFTGIVQPGYSSMEATLDLDDAGTFSAGALTISSDNQFCGRFLMTTTANRNITSIVDLPTLWECRFVATALGFNITFTTTGKATIAGNQIAGTAASFVATLGATGTTDSVWVEKLFTYNTITRTNILI